jgi:hypothetical protein
MIEYMYQIWIYGERQMKDMKIVEFEYYDLYHSIQNVIQNVFIHDKLMRRKVMDGLQELRKRTENSRELYGDYWVDDIQEFRKSTENSRKLYGDYWLASNQYSMEWFFGNLFTICYPQDIPNILSIADFIENYDIDYLYFFLYSIFQRFIEIDFSKESSHINLYIEEFQYKFNEKYNEKLTFLDRLFQLFTSGNYFIHVEFEDALEFRREEWNTEEYDD